MATPSTTVSALKELLGLPKALDALTAAEKEQWFKDLVGVLDHEFRAKQKLDDLIRLGPGIEQISDIALDYIFDEALPKLLAGLAQSIDGD